jgi:chloride channel protein, CIC family
MIKLKSIRPTDDQKFLILNIVTGLCAGVVAIFFYQSIHKLMHWFGTDEGFTIKSFLLGGISLFIASYITTRIVPECSGAGIARTKILLAVHHSVIRTREWLIKIGVTILSLASGVPLGSEAPTIAISAGIGSSLGRKFKFKERNLKSLVYAGCSAGIAAAFNTPIAAVIFTTEEIIGNSNTKSMGPILISSLVASVTAASLIGQNSIFTPVQYSFNATWQQLGFYIGLGVFAGLAGPLFITNILGIKKLIKKYFKEHRLTVIMFSFLMVGIFSQIVEEVPGNGLNVINELLQGHVASIQILAALLIFKFLASALCYGAGISGGILMPVLFLGAALGGLFGTVSTYTLGIDQVEVGAYCLVGMGAFFASVIRTPFTSIVLVFEMTRDYRIILPLMLANLIAYFLSESILKGNLYEKIALFDGYELPHDHDEEYLINAQVAEAFKPQTLEEEPGLHPSEMIYTDHTLAYAMNKLKKLGMNKSLKVVHRMRAKEVIGKISLQDIFDYLAK